MKTIVRDNTPDEGKPALIEMDAIDASHAIAADPARYSIESAKPYLPPPTLEQRVARLEMRLGPETPEEIEHRARRNREFQERVAEENSLEPPHPSAEELEAARLQAEAENQSVKE